MLFVSCEWTCAVHMLRRLKRRGEDLAEFFAMTISFNKSRRHTLHENIPASSILYFLVRNLEHREAIT
jgi:hypothetical protein